MHFIFYEIQTPSPSCSPTLPISNIFHDKAPSAHPLCNPLTGSSFVYSQTLVYFVSFMLVFPPVP
jgi:hypothetical protein